MIRLVNFNMSCFLISHFKREWQYLAKLLPEISKAMYTSVIYVLYICILYRSLACQEGQMNVDFFFFFSLSQFVLYCFSHVFTSHPTFELSTLCQFYFTDEETEASAVKWSAPSMPSKKWSNHCVVNSLSISPNCLFALSPKSNSRPVDRMEGGKSIGPFYSQNVRGHLLHPWEQYSLLALEGLGWGDADTCAKDDASASCAETLAPCL